MSNRAPAATAHPSNDNATISDATRNNVDIASPTRDEIIKKLKKSTIVGPVGDKYKVLAKLILHGKELIFRA